MENKTTEAYLREAFTENLINMGVYPDAIHRPKIYRAMNEYAQQELSAYKERLKEAIVSNGDFRPYTIINLIDTL